MRKVISLLLLGVLGQCYAYENVALRGKATQSSRLFGEWGAGSGAINAIDGNRNTNYHAGSCSHTTMEAGPWWRVDLLDKYVITSVTIYNRGDCCPERIIGAEIHIGNSIMQFGLENLLAGVITEIPLSQAYTLTIEPGIKGRYVTINIPGKRTPLTLCEVEVYGFRAPTALQGRATQSSLYSANPLSLDGHCLASNAIDGNHEGMWERGSCTLTGSDTNPWWRLDLHKTHKIFSVSITSRADASPEKIDGAEIRVGNSLENNGNNNPRCAVISNMPEGGTDTFMCEGMDGRYVNVYIPGRTQHLSLCEVEVYGSVLD